MKNYIGSEEHFEDSVNAYYDQIEEQNQRQRKEEDQRERDLYYSQEISELEREMQADKWHVKLLRWLRLRYWLIWCNVFNNKIVRKWKC